MSVQGPAKKQPFAQDHYPLRYLMVHRPEASSLPKTKQKPNTQQLRRYHCRDHSFSRNQQTCEHDTYLVKLLARSTLPRLSFCLCLEVRESGQCRTCSTQTKPRRFGIDRKSTRLNSSH